MRYLVVIGDIVASRAVRTRGELQRSLAGAVERANAVGADRLASPYTITLGDEFQAVYRKATALFADFWRLLEAIHPVQLRLSAGIGEITTALNRRQALGMDGPAFYRARQGMDEMKRLKGSIIQIEAGTEALRLVNQSLRLLSRLLGGWKRDTLSTLVFLAEGLLIEEIARRRKVTERAVFKRIRTNNLREVLMVAEAIEAEIDAAMQSADER